MAKFFGTPDGLKVGDLFDNRAAMTAAGITPHLINGIHGTEADGADAVVLNGGYEDRDYGDYIIYTGEGGRENGSSRHTKPQSPDSPGNAVLITSQVLGLPVRVTRGADKKNPYSPPVGYQYAGLFLVTDWWITEGRHGYDVLQFRLERIDEQEELQTSAEPDPEPAYVTTVVSRRIRDSAISRRVKSLYANKCQVCGTAVRGIGDRFYSEGAHVKPLGRPHLGADAMDNLLCLCPNHHTQLDIGGLIILDDFTVATSPEVPPFGALTFKKNHQLELSNAQYHRAQWSSS